MGLEALGCIASRVEFAERLLLHAQVGLDVDVRGLQALVTKPQSDDRWIHASLEQVHRGGMPKHMRGDGFVGQRRDAPLCANHSLVE